MPTIFAVYFKQHGKGPYSGLTKQETWPFLSSAPDDIKCENWGQVICS